MLEIGASEAKNKLDALLDRVQNGEENVITRHGKAVARLVPTSGIDKAQVTAAFERIRAQAKTLKIKFDWEMIKTDRDAGRA